MERELQSTFESARKAAEAAGREESPEAARCVEALERLREIPVTTAVLVSTQIGKRLRSLAKHPHSQIQSVASDLLAYWKQVVIEETSKEKKYDKPTKVEKGGKEQTVNAEKGSEPTKSAEKRETKGSVGEIEFAKTGKNTCGISEDEAVGVKRARYEKRESGKGERREVSESSGSRKPTSASDGIPKLASLVKCNDSTRDKIRELLADAFMRVAGETSKDDRDEIRNLLDEVDASDPFRVAVTVESALFDKLGRSTGTYKQKYRSIMFNLRAENNTDFRRRVLLGQVKPEKIIDLSPEEMASDARKQENRQIQEKALFECERGGPAKATTDQFKCGRCGQRKTTYYQMQTRSADEPMTTYVTCMNCDNRWKFC